MFVGFEMNWTKHRALWNSYRQGQKVGLEILSFHQLLMIVFVNSEPSQAFIQNSLGNSYSYLRCFSDFKLTILRLLA